MRFFVLACFMAITFFLAPLAIFASPADLSPTLSDLTKKFSEKFCTSIDNGLTPEKAGETAAVQLSKGVLFSPVMNEIMSTPKEDLALSLSNNIFAICGTELGGTKEDLDYYLVQLTTKVPNKATNSFQHPPIRQIASK